MNVIETTLPGVLLIEPRVFGDERGFFMETYQASRYAEAGIAGPFVQDNLSLSRHGILRGLHLQHPGAQGKLVSVLKGEVFDVAVDVRTDSPTFGQWVGEYLSETNKRQLWVPEGFAHGFCVTSDEALFAYKCTRLYSPQTEISIRWDDPAIGIQWPVDAPALSQKDQAGLFLADIAPDQLPAYMSETTS
ncbi:dTDP-4-dehydrorhamnose 3,5-epimerase [Thioalkalivibrio sulfidiphilus HL-EbGr7]|uniref:dTDP-4-dehydrorhamnose 3,5-epimerase n=1 Tax=Thioalkalivibrio sulfidiphilus (strain HL-EbGR7) TaxID=396588 RepID=B8GV76_THISH|nr:dTDP-4-dehydrorhamnose 3,5-epimerase [Thioalkalivibrio sulfidiphilus]ACL73422.1 dTDP-4-dehydrorhamnose 3,5-epimerase [Thioalkalivibrio sulfidiphilus HL-EbGr7]